MEQDRIFCCSGRCFAFLPSPCHFGSIFALFRVYFRLKLSPTSRCCPGWPIFFKNLFYQNSCKEAMNMGGGQIRGALFNIFVVKKCPFCIFRMLPSVSKITPAFTRSQSEKSTFLKKWKKYGKMLSFSKHVP